MFTFSNTFSYKLHFNRVEEIDTYKRQFLSRSVWLEVSKTNGEMELDHVIMLGYQTAKPFVWLFQLLQFTSKLIALKRPVKNEFSRPPLTS